jgi:16S rRNA processing protein RimM
MDVVVGRLGRPQGLRGELTVEVRTDEPDHRFAIGATLLALRPDPTGPGGSGSDGVPAGTLTVRAARWHSGRLVLAFDEAQDRTAAEGLRGLLLAVAVDPDERPADPEEFYDHQLVGLTARTPEGVDLGEVAEVLHLPAQDVLVVRGAEGEVLVPFVSAIVTAVDLAARIVTVDPPPGLLGEADAVDDGDPAAAEQDRA